MQYQVIREFVDTRGFNLAIGDMVDYEPAHGARLCARGYLAQVIPAEVLQFVIVSGSPGLTTSREENLAALASARVLAAAVRAELNDHYADVLAHTTAADAVNPVSGSDPQSVAQIIAFTTELMTSYVAHDDDAELAALWVYHAAQEGGNHSLASVVAPTSLEESVTRLVDLKAKLNAHDADAVAHGVASAHQVAAADAAYGAVVRIPDAIAAVGDMVGWSIIDAGAGAVTGVTATALAEIGRAHV